MSGWRHSPLACGFSTEALMFSLLQTDKSETDNLRNALPAYTATLPFATALFSRSSASWKTWCKASLAKQAGPSHRATILAPTSEDAQQASRVGATSGCPTRKWQDHAGEQQPGRPSRRHHIPKRLLGRTARAPGRMPQASRQGFANTRGCGEATLAELPQLLRRSADFCVPAH